MPVLLTLAIAQVIGWGTVGFPAVIGREVAASLGMSLPEIFAGNSILYLGMAFIAPWLSTILIRQGARPVMMVGALLSIPGFILLSVATGPISFFCGWIVLGIAASATLSTPAFIMLNEVAGSNARRAISTLMLATGLSYSVFWPITAFLTHWLSWRNTCLCYAGLFALVCFPLYCCGLPRRHLTPRGAAVAVSHDPHTLPVSSPVFLSMTIAMTLNAFITVGFSTLIIELLKTEGLSAHQALILGSTLGILQVSARAIDLFGGTKWDGITTGLYSCLIVLAAFVVLLVGSDSLVVSTMFVLLYGIGSGVLVVSRATIPLVFYDKAEFAKASSMLALPLNLVAAIAPPCLVGLMAHVGPTGILNLAILISGTSAVILWALSHHRPKQGGMEKQRTKRETT